jgi:MFS family permease
MPAWFYSMLPNKVGIGSSINLPPIFLTEVLGGNVATVGIASALTSAATVPAATLWGWLSDRYGTRRTYLMLGYLGFALPTLLTAFTTSVWQYLLLVAILGAWSVAGTPVASTLIMDTVPRSDWDETFGRFNAISGWGIVLGRLVGLLCIAYGIGIFGNVPTQRGLWIISGTLSLVSVIWAWRVVPQPRMPKPRRVHPHNPELIAGGQLPPLGRFGATMRGLRHLPPNSTRRFVTGTLPRIPGALVHKSRQGLRNPLIAYYFTTFVMFTMSVMAYTPFAVWQRQVLGNSTATVFLVGMVNSIASALSYRWVGRLIKRYGSMRVQMVTNSARIITFGGFAVIGWMGITGTRSLVLLLLLNAISGLGWAGIAVAGNTTVAHLAPRGSEGAAVGTYTSFVSVGSILGAFISGYLVLLTNFEIVFALGASGVALTVWFLYRIRASASPEAREHL